MSKMWIGYERAPFSIKPQVVIYHGYKPNADTYAAKHMLEGPMREVPEDIEHLPLNMIEDIMKGRGLL